MKLNSLPNWITEIDEISNGVFNVVLTDNFGRKVEVTGSANQETIDKAIGNAFEIKKQTSLNWNKFLFDLCSMHLTENKITKILIHDKDFGSWTIEVNDKRFLYLGKEKWLISQTHADNKWFDNYIIKEYDLNYIKLQLFLTHMS